MSHPDPKMERLLEIVNLFPPGADTVEEMSTGLDFSVPEGRRVFNREFERQVRELPKTVRAFIGPLRDPVKPNEIRRLAVRQYDRLVESRFLMTLIASQNRAGLEELRAHKMSMNEENLGKLWRDRDWLDLVFSQRVTELVIEEVRGQLKWRPPVLLEALQKRNGILRIRECNVCLRLFWAGRIDQVACGPPRPCANRLRYRRYYEIHLKSERKRKKVVSKRANQKT